MTDFTKTFHRTSYNAIAPTKPSNEQTGKTILITGGCENVGLEIASAFCSAHASHVVVTSRSASKASSAASSLQESHPTTKISSRVCDLSDGEAVANFWRQLSHDNIFVDVLVLNAAPTTHPRTVPDTLIALRGHMDANLYMLESYQNHGKEADSDAKATKPKCLILISSAGLHLYPYDNLAYAAGKAGMATYLCHLSDVVQEQEMRMVIIHPGAIYTSAAERAGKIDANMPIWDDPSLSAHATVWCAGKEAGFLHGRFVWANWDVEELIQMKAAILEDPGMLKIGVTGVNSCSFPKFMEKCVENPVPKST